MTAGHISVVPTRWWQICPERCQEKLGRRTKFTGFTILNRRVNVCVCVYVSK